MRIAFFLAILMITPLALCGPVLASPPTQGDTVNITDTVVWNDGTFDGEIIVKEGGSLHWSGDIMIEQDALITVEEGGTLHFDSANIQTENAASTLVLYDGTEIGIDEDIDDTSALFHSNAEFMMLKAAELAQTGGFVFWNQATFSIANHGTLIMNHSTIMAADIACTGPCSIENSDLYGSGPIHVADGSSLEFVESTMLGSRTDEDIILHDQASIEYTNSSGTGGYTDSWIRLLSKRELVVNAPVATVLGTGIGYSGATINTVIYGELNDSSTWTVNIGTNEHKRIVEWLDGDGIYGQESGSIKVTVETNWGDFVVDTVAPRTASANIDVVYPQLSIDKVEPEAVTADTGKSHGVMVTISNTGTVAVDPNVRCYVDGVEAQIPSITTANWAVEPGETKDVPVTWYHQEDGAVQLTCKFLYPDILDPVSYLIASETGTTSGEVSFTTAEEVDELPIVLYGAIILMVVIFAAVIAVRAGKEVTKDYVAEETHPEIDDSNQSETVNESEDKEEWLDADGNAIIGTE